MLIGIVGNDENRKKIENLLKEDKITSRLVFENGRITTVKSRIIINDKQVCRIDDENTTRIFPRTENEVIKNIKNEINSVDGVIISDYLKGLVTDKIAKYLINASKKRGIKVFVDSKSNNLGKYRDCYLIKINRKEAEKSTKRKLGSMEKIKKAANTISKKYNCHVVLTLDHEGLIYSDGNNLIIKRNNKKNHYIKSTIGAGDSVLAGIALTILSGGDLKEIAEIGSMCGYLTVKKKETIFCKLEEITRAIK